MSRRGGRGGGSNNKSTLTASKELLKRSASEAGLDDRHIKVLSDITRPPLFPDFLWKSTGHYWSEDDYNTIDNSNNNNTSNVKIENEQQQQPKPSIKSTTKLATSMISLINKQRDMTQRFQNSSYYVRPNNVVDVIRYRDRKNFQNTNQSPDAKVLSSFSLYNVLATDTTYFPEELLLLNTNHSNKKRSSVSSKGHSQQQKTRPQLNESLQNKITTNNGTNAVAIKLEELDNQEMAIISSSSSSKIRATSITSLSIGNESDNVKSRENEKGNNNEGDDDVNDDDDEDITLPMEEEELVEDYTTNYYATDDEDDGDDGEPTY